MQSNSKDDRFGLSGKTIEQITSVFSRYPELETAILYGSRAMGNDRNGSDIDLTLVGEQLTYQRMLRIENEIDDLLLPYLFDFSLFRHIENPNVVDHINRVGVLFYERPTHVQPTERSEDSLKFNLPTVI